jgi:hypothetical protein
MGEKSSSSGTDGVALGIGGRLVAGVEGYVEHWFCWAWSMWAFEHGCRLRQIFAKESRGEARIVGEVSLL